MIELIVFLLAFSAGGMAVYALSAPDGELRDLRQRVEWLENNRRQLVAALEAASDEDQNEWQLDPQATTALRAKLG